MLVALLGVVLLPVGVTLRAAIRDARPPSTSRPTLPLEEALAEPEAEPEEASAEAGDTTSRANLFVALALLTEDGPLVVTNLLED